MRALIVAVAAALALPAAAFAELTFHPLAHGDHTYASWKAKEGQLDSHGNAEQAFYLQNAELRGTAASGVVQGIEGVRTSGLTGLSYEHRHDSVCTPLSPRWALFLQGARSFEGQRRQYLVNLGCATSPARPGSEPGWIERTWPQPVIRTAILRAGGTDALAGRVLRLALVLDRAVGSAWLDNIVVRSQQERGVWTYAGDNGQGQPSSFSATELLLLGAEPTEYELMTEDELLATLTVDEWELISLESYEAYEETS